MSVLDDIKAYNDKLYEAAGIPSDAVTQSSSVSEASTISPELSKLNLSKKIIVVLLLGWAFYRYYYRPVVKGYGYK